MTIILTACVYRIDTPQGVVISPKEIRQVKKGMSREQVANILGSPLLTNTFHNNRVDYYRSLIPGSQSNTPPFKQNTVIYYNKHNKVTSIKNKNFLPPKPTPKTT